MEPTLTLQPSWSPATKLAFRFFFVYFALYVTPFPITLIPFVGFGIQPFHQLYSHVTDALGKMMLGAAYVLQPASTGSGDTMHNYVQLLLSTSLASIITVIWSVLDRKRDNYEKLLYWLIVLLRYCVGIFLISYGFAKIFKTQFPFPSPDQLNKSYGESSPMNLLWTFMGYSTPYNIFTGLGEAGGGLLLLFKRTRLLGSIVVVIVMGHVVMLNFAYDVPVKLFSMHLLAMAIFIMIPDMKRLANMFILNKPVQPEPITPVYINNKTRWAYLGLKSLLFVSIALQVVAPQWANKKEVDNYVAQLSQVKSFDGQYDVETFILNNDTLPPLDGDTRRWKTMVVNGRKMDLQSMDGASITWHFLGNVGYRRAIMCSTDLSTSGNFTFYVDSTVAFMEGKLNENNLKVIARKKSERKPFLLVDRGFHWVNEYPFNK